MAKIYNKTYEVSFNILDSWIDEENYRYCVKEDSFITSLIDKNPSAFAVGLEWNGLIGNPNPAELPADIEVLNYETGEVGIRLPISERYGKYGKVRFYYCEPQLANPSLKTIKERNKFITLLDDFSTFYWDGYNMFIEFGAFIINEKKGSLKIYNGPSFKNEYSKPQFQDGYTNISGITFDTQTISFTIGVYWISIEDYRILMNLLHPYSVSRLQFSFEEKYGYNCKLQSIKDSTRYIVGKEWADTTSVSSEKLQYSRLNSGDQKGYRYYTELTLTFDIIGAQCAIATEQINYFPLGFISGINIFDNNRQAFVFDETVDTDLPMPIKFTLQWPVTYDKIEIIGTAIIEAPNSANNNNIITNSIQIFDIILKNLKDKDITLYYDSEQGLIYWQNGNKEQILSLLSSNDNGERIVEYMDVKQFYWPGRLDHTNIEGEEHFMAFQLKGIDDNVDPIIINRVPLTGKMTYIRAARTNII